MKNSNIYFVLYLMFISWKRIYSLYPNPNIAKYIWVKHSKEIAISKLTTIWLPLYYFWTQIISLLFILYPILVRISKSHSCFLNSISLLFLYPSVLLFVLGDNHPCTIVRITLGFLWQKDPFVVLCYNDYF